MQTHWNQPPGRIPDRRLIVFGRYPVPGRVKSRLIPFVGELGAAELQRRWTERAIDISLGAFLAPVEFCCTGGRLGQIHRWLGRRMVSIRPQTNGDLGSRMKSAIDTALGQGCQQVVLIGTDVPQMESRHLAAAFETLADHDVVLGPTLDGGYWLVGCRRPADIFTDMAWGSSDVLNQTLAAADKQGLSVAQLAPLNDMDTEADLVAWQPQKQWRRPYLTVIIPALNEASFVTAAVQQVQSPDIQTIVVDGGSTDGTAARAEEAGAKVIDAPPGRALQQNAGARLAAGQVLLFLHADARLPTGFAQQIFETLMDRRTVLGAFEFKTDYHHRGMQLIEKAVHIRSKVFHLPYGDQALFMPKAVFENVGGFPQVPIAEDLFLVRRLAGLGRIGLAPGAVITSGRLWRAMGIWRYTIINYLIAGGCLLGIDPRQMAPLYRFRSKISGRLQGRLKKPNQP